MLPAVSDEPSPGAAAAQAAPPAPSVAVVIPVKDDRVRLDACLTALDAQDYAGPFEVIVVDNGSREDPADIVARHPRTRLLYEQRPSSYAARNAAARATGADVLAFTDSDCLPRPDWVRRGVEALLAAPAPAFVAGHVTVVPADAAATTPIERYEMLHAFPQQEYIERERFGVTANLLVARRDFERVGEFDAVLVSSGDREWGQRASAAGVRGVYAAEAVVQHPARRTYAEFRNKMRRVQVGAYQLRDRRGERLRRRDVVRFAARPPVRRTVTYVRAVRPATFSNRLRYVVMALFLYYLGLVDRVRITADLERRARDGAG
jgi:glycosyltransferase involved in cell wall biosynthesis